MAKGGSSAFLAPASRRAASLKSFSTGFFAFLDPCRTRNALKQGEWGGVGASVKLSEAFFLDSAKGHPILLENPIS